VINTNLHPISHRFQVIAHYLSNLRFRSFDVVVMSLTHSFGLNPYTREHEVWPQEIRNIALS